MSAQGKQKKKISRGEAIMELFRRTWERIEAIEKEKEKDMNILNLFFDVIMMYLLAGIIVLVFVFFIVILQFLKT